MFDYSIKHSTLIEIFNATFSKKISPKGRVNLFNCRGVGRNCNKANFINLFLTKRLN